MVDTIQSANCIHKNRIAVDIGNVQYTAVQIAGSNVVSDDLSITGNSCSKRTVFTSRRISQTTRIPSPDFCRFIKILVISDINLIFGDSHIATELTTHDKICRILNCTLHIALIRSFFNQCSVIANCFGQRGFWFSELNRVVLICQHVIYSLNAFCGRLHAEFFEFNCYCVTQFHSLQTCKVLILL